LDAETAVDCAYQWCCDTTMSNPSVSTIAFANSLAGGLASVLSLAITYPLDQLRTVQQAQGTNTREALLAVYETDGWGGFYKGISSGLTAMGLSWGTYYYCFSLFQYRARLKYGTLILAEVTNLRIAAQAGVITCVLMEPVWVVNTRQKLAKADPSAPQMSIFGHLLDICWSEGIGKLFGGILPSLLLVSNPALQFMTAEWLRRFPAMHGRHFLLGAISKLVSTVLTYPIQTIKTKLQKRQCESPKRDSGAMKVDSNSDIDVPSPLLSTNQSATTKFGKFVLLYQGMSVKILGTVLTAAFMFLFHSILVKFTLPLLVRLKQRRSRSWEQC